MARWSRRRPRRAAAPAPASGCSPPRSRSSSSRATRAPGSRTSPAPPASPPARSTPTSATRPSCCSRRSAPAPASRSTRCSPSASGREPRALLELLGDQLVRPRRQPPLLIDAIAAARRDDEPRGGAARTARRARESCSSTSSTARKADGTIDPALDSDVVRALRHRRSQWERSCSARLGIDAAGPEGAWHDTDLASARSHRRHRRSNRHDRSITTTHRRRLELVHAVTAEFDTIFTWDYERSRPPLDEALREGEDVAVERVDRSRLVDRRRPREGRRRARSGRDRSASRRWPRPRARR